MTEKLGTNQSPEPARPNTTKEKQRELILQRVATEHNVQVTDILGHPETPEGRRARATAIYLFTDPIFPLATENEVKDIFQCSVSEMRAAIETVDGVVEIGDEPGKRVQHMRNTLVDRTRTSDLTEDRTNTETREQQLVRLAAKYFVIETPSRSANEFRAQKGLANSAMILIARRALKKRRKKQ